MRFLYGIKNCSSCSKRESCNLKNDPNTLVKKVQVFEVINRGILRHPYPQRNAKRESFCKYFSPEEKQPKDKVEELAKKLNVASPINPIIKVNNLPKTKEELEHILESRKVAHNWKIRGDKNDKKEK